MHFATRAATAGSDGGPSRPFPPFAACTPRRTGTDSFLGVHAISNRAFSVGHPYATGLSTDEAWKSRDRKRAEAELQLSMQGAFPGGVAPPVISSVSRQSPPPSVPGRVQFLDLQPRASVHPLLRLWSMPRRGSRRALPYESSLESSKGHPQ